MLYRNGILMSELKTANYLLAIFEWDIIGQSALNLKIIRIK